MSLQCLNTKYHTKYKKDHELVKKIIKNATEKEYKQIAKIKSILKSFDKLQFPIIENHLMNEDHIEIANKIENYIDNYLNLDIKVIADEYFEQVIRLNNFNIENIIPNILEQLNNNIITKRNNIRSFIKKGVFELKDLTNFLKTFFKKIIYLSNILNIESSINQICIEPLNNLIISDSIILIYIEEQVIEFNNDVKEFLLFLKNEHYNFKKIIKFIGNSYLKHFLNNDDILGPINIKRIQQIDNTEKYYNSIFKYYWFIRDDKNEICFPITNLILDQLIEIIKNNSLHEIEYTLNNIWKFIKNIKKFYYDSEKNSLIMNKFEIASNELLNKCSESILSIDNIKLNIKMCNHSLLFNKTSHYNKNNIFITNIVKSIISYFNNNYSDEVEIISFINNSINNDILNNRVNDIKILILISTYLDSIDIFINNYYDLLVKRLTLKMKISVKSEFDIYIQTEKYIINTYLSNLPSINTIDDNFYNKINTIINDTERSFYENIEFNKFSNNLLKKPMSVLTTSFESWNINQTEGLLNNKIINTIKHTQLGKYLKYYELYYVGTYNNKRIINWFPHFGEINITYLNQKLKMLPIQFMIVEMFNDVDKIPLTEIFKSSILSNYTDKFKKDIIDSIIMSELFIIKDTDIILSQSDNIKNDLIEIFLNISNYSKELEQFKEYELSFSRDEIVNTIINHSLKTGSKTKTDLFLLIKEKIKLFKLEDEIFNKSLKYLIELDYIKLNDSDEYEQIV